MLLEVATPMHMIAPMRAGDAERGVRVRKSKITMPARMRREAP